MNKRLFLVTASLLLGSCCLLAQRTYIDKSINSSLNQIIDLPRSSFHIDLGVGNSVEAGVHIQRNFNRIISWDILSARYIKHLTKSDYYIAAMTGVRVHTPSFGKRRQMKAYIALDLGYGGYSRKVNIDNPYSYNGEEYPYSETVKRWNGGFAACPEVGIFLSNHFSLGVCATIIEGNFNPALRIGISL